MLPTGLLGAAADGYSFGRDPRVVCVTALRVDQAIDALPRPSAGPAAPGTRSARQWCCLSRCGSIVAVSDVESTHLSLTGPNSHVLVMKTVVVDTIASLTTDNGCHPSS